MYSKGVEAFLAFEENGREQKAPPASKKRRNASVFMSFGFE